MASIAATTLDAAAAFEEYGNQRTSVAEVNSISLLPGDLCGYSGQQLIGMLAENRTRPALTTPIESRTCGPIPATS